MLWCTVRSVYVKKKIKQASESAIVERRQFQGNGDFMDFFQGNFYLNGFVVKEVRRRYCYGTHLTVYITTTLYFYYSTFFMTKNDQLLYDPVIDCYLLLLPVTFFAWPVAPVAQRYLVTL